MTEMIERVALGIIARADALRRARLFERVGMPSSDYALALELARAAIEAMPIEQLRAALVAAREKLQLYRRSFGGEYVGGMEYTALMRMIDAALK